MAIYSSGINRQWLVGDHLPQEAYHVLYSEDRQFLVSDRASANLYAQHTQVLYRVLDMELFSESRQMLAVLDATPSVVGAYAQGMSGVVSSRPVPPPALTISYETVNQSFQLVTQASPDLPFLWSPVSVGHQAVQVVQSKEITAQSAESVPSVVSTAAGRAVYTRPEDVTSVSAVAAAGVLVCQSSEIPYIPPSGEYVPQQVVAVTQAADYPSSYRSMSSVRSAAVKVAQRRTPEKLPRSKTRAAGTVTQAVTQRDSEGLPLGWQMSAQSFSQAVTATEMPQPVGVVQGSCVSSLAVSPSVMPEPVGAVESAGAFALALTQSDVLGLPSSPVDTPSVASLAITRSDYDLPGDVLAAERSSALSQLVTQSVEYPAAEIRSFSSYGQGRLQYTQATSADVYPDLDGVYAASKFAFSASVQAMTVQQSLSALPLSRMRAPQLRVISLSSLPQASLEEISNRGVFNYQAIEHVAVSTEYPATNDPISYVDAHQVLSHAAFTATYPPAVNQVDVSAHQVMQHAMVASFYPDPSDQHSPVSVYQAASNIATTDSFRDAGSLHAPVLMFSLSEAVAFGSNYPNKDTPQSAAQVAAVTQSAAFRSAYPGKDTAQSLAQVGQVRQNIARRDSSMYEMPAPPRRHRVRIVCRVVY